MKEEQILLDKHKYKIIVLLIVLLIASTCENFRLNDRVDETKAMYENASKETLIYRNKLGQSEAAAEIVKSQKVADFVKAIFSDPAMIALQNSVKENGKKLKNGGSVTYFNSETIINKSGKTDTSIDSIGNVTFTSKYSDEWLSYSTIANKDTTKLKVSMRNEYDVVLGSEKDSTLGFFKRLVSEPKTRAWVTSKNPYDEIKEMKAYQVKGTSPSRFAATVNVGYGFDLANIGIKPYLGIGISYRLFYIGKGKTLND